jgi:class 3 adenylate cyclase
MEQSKTWLCSVVFLDIAGYTQRSVTRQVNAKGFLQRLIEESVADTPENERTILDTGDGAALCFLGDPERALFAALQLRESLTQPSADRAEAVLVRIGINLGPVRFVRSLGGQANPLGDGINNAQRVMNFAAPNQILVSRSFYEVIACLSQEYAQLFTYLGVRRDKHVKEHAVYEVRVPSETGGVVTLHTTQVIAERARATTRPAVTWDPAMLQRAEQALAEFIGPVARVLVKKASGRAHDAAELGRLLVDAIPLEAQREKVLEVVLGAQAGAAAPRAGASSGSVPAESAGERDSPAAGTDGGGRPLTPQEIKQAEERLAGYLGPLARVLIKRTMQQTQDRKRFYELLAAELDVPEARKAFLDSAGE